MNDTPHRLKIARTADGVGVNLNSNYRTLYFSNEMWAELFAMMSALRASPELRTLQNYEESIREPYTSHSPPSRVSLDDLA